MAQRPARTHEELEFGMRGTTYVVRQLVWSGVLLSEGGLFSRMKPWSSEYEIAHPWVPNALIESFLSYARRTAQFLKGAPPTDVYAGDYMSSWQDWKPAGPIIGQVSEVLSHARYKPPPEPYRWRMTVDPLVDGLLVFIDRLEAAESEWLDSFGSLRQVIDAVRSRIRNPS